MAHKPCQCNRVRWSVDALTSRVPNLSRAHKPKPLPCPHRWVPLLFGLAGVILGVSHPLLDAWQAARGGEQPRGGSDPSWTFVLAGVALFVLQYAASGALEQPLLGSRLPGLGVPALDAVLAVTAAAHWWTFDGTRQGAFMAALTAVAGPGVEILLINLPHLYAYTHPAWLGTPTWICWVYACGAPAVGNLGRKVSSALLARRQAP